MDISSKIPQSNTNSIYQNDPPYVLFDFIKINNKNDVINNLFNFILN